MSTKFLQLQSSMPQRQHDAILESRRSTNCQNDTSEELLTIFFLFFPSFHSSTLFPPKTPTMRATNERKNHFPSFFLSFLSSLFNSSHDRPENLTHGSVTNNRFRKPIFCSFFLSQNAFFLNFSQEKFSSNLLLLLLFSLSIISSRDKFYHKLILFRFFLFLFSFFLSFQDFL